MRQLLFVLGFLCAALPAARAQFSNKWLQDESYWGDGKAEFNIYEAQEVRYGQPRPCEIIHIYVRESFSPTELVKADDWTKPGTFPVLKLNQILHVPTGLYSYQQMHSSYWRTDSGALIKATLTSNDSCGNTYKELRALSGWRAWFGSGWTYQWRTYWEGMSAGEETVQPQSGPLSGAFFYDELPMRVRTIDFSAHGASGVFKIQVFPTIIASKKDQLKAMPATVQWRREATRIRVTIGHKPGGEDVFHLDKEPPFLLREWQRSDGSSLFLKRSLKIDYWNHNKLGDREKALSVSE